MANKNKTIYIGASIRGADPEEKKLIVSHVRTVCDLIKAHGYEYFVDKSMLDTTINVTRPVVKIPRRFYKGISKSLFNKIVGLRDTENRSTLRDDIAMCRWTDELLVSAAGCIWLHDRSQTGSGIEIYRALYELDRQCLVFYSTRSITSLLKGRTTRLLTTRRWNDDTVDKEIEKFLGKIESGYDRACRVLLSEELESFARQQAKALADGGVSEYIRGLIMADREKNK